MDNAIWIAIVAAAIGTLLMRLLPLLWMQRRLARRRDEHGAEAMPPWLGVLGPAMIAAMLGVSLVPAAFTVTSWVASVFGVMLTMLVWFRTQSLGWPVLAGVVIYGAVILLAGAIA